MCVYVSKKKGGRWEEKERMNMCLGVSLRKGGEEERESEGGVYMPVCVCVCVCRRWGGEKRGGG